jgi:hypothetical protein
MAMTAGFLILYLVLPVISTHEVGLLRKLSIDFSHTISLCSSPNLVDGHEALLMCVMGSCGNLVEHKVEVADRESCKDATAPFCSLRVASSSGVLGFSSLVGGCISRQLVV